MNRKVSAPKFCKAARREELPRIGEERDGGFVVQLHEETLEYSVRRFVEDVPPLSASVAPVPLPRAIGERAGR